MKELFEWLLLCDKSYRKPARQHVTRHGVDINMEHRCDKRFTAQWNVVIRMRNGAVVNSTAQNVSRGGLYLRADCPEGFTGNGVVKLVIQAGHLMLIIPALVIRQDGNAVALMFIEHAATRTRMLNTLLESDVQEQWQKRAA